MSFGSALPFATDIKTIKENYDTSNPVVAEIIKVKEQRLKILQDLTREQEKDFSWDLQLDDSSKLKKDLNVENKKKTKKSDKSFPQISLRRSTRLLNSPTVVYKESDENFTVKNELEKTSIVRPPNDYGPVPGVEIGFHWETRMECSFYGVHRPTVAGIHGGPNGAYSIALSGGYPEDIDEGYSFIYTGAGGRDLKGTSAKPKNLRIAPQTKDQQLEGTNLSLVKSIESKLPIRVIRGYKSPSVFAPDTGYRYDGLYQVVKYWEDRGKSGHRIYRFKMERMENQPPPPWVQKNDHILKQDNKIKVSKSTHEVSDEEFKENIRPININDCNESSSSQLSKDLNDVESEIENCIQFFSHFVTIKNWSSSNEIMDDSNFQGWDAL